MRRKDDFSVLSNDTRIPLFSTANDEIYRKRLLEDTEESDEYQVGGTFSVCFYTQFSQIPLVVKAKTRDIRVPSSSDKVLLIQSWADEIEIEYNVLVERKPSTYGKQTADMEPISYLKDFRIKETVGSDLRLILKEIC